MSATAPRWAGMVASLHGHLPQALLYKRWRFASIFEEAPLPCRSRLLSTNSCFSISFLGMKKAYMSINHAPICIHARLTSVPPIQACI